MPMLTSESQKPEDKAETTEPEQAEAEPAEDTEPEAEKAEVVAEAETITKGGKPKRKRSKAKEPVAVA
jgi:DNA polymerase-3 subunit beta